jgi:anion-transporting  ArsA/GET3 family ATPase
VNRVLPEELLKEKNVPAYLRNRMQMQQGYLAKIEEQLGKQVVAQVPEMERDVTGLDMIKKLSEIMYSQTVGEKL